MKSFNEYNHERYADDKKRNLKENKTKRKSEKQNLKHLINNQLGDDVDPVDEYDDDEFDY